MEMRLFKEPLQFHLFRRKVLVLCRGPTLSKTILHAFYLGWVRFLFCSMPWHFDDDDDDDCSLACMHAILLSLIDYQLRFLLLLRGVELPLLDIFFFPFFFWNHLPLQKGKKCHMPINDLLFSPQVGKRAHIYGYTPFSFSFLTLWNQISRHWSVWTVKEHQTYSDKIMWLFCLGFCVRIREDKIYVT